MTYQEFVRTYGYEFGINTDHRTNTCRWCGYAKDTALEHMRDASLRTTKSTKYEPDDTPHVVHLTRLRKDTSTIPETVHFSTKAPWGLSGTYVRQEDREPIDMSDRGLNRYVNNATPNETALITEVVNLRIKLSRQRPVVLDLEEGEAALLLGLLNEEVDAQGVKGDVDYQNGAGFEAECALAREEERQAEALADRLRKLLGKHLDKAYAGELES